MHLPFMPHIPMPRTLASLLVLVLLGQLASCASTAPGQEPAQSASQPLLTAPVLPAAVSVPTVAAADASADAAASPVASFRVPDTLAAGEAGLEYAERLAGLGARVRVPTTLNVSGLDEQHWQAMLLPPAAATAEAAAAPERQQPKLHLEAEPAAEEVPAAMAS